MSLAATPEVAAFEQFMSAIETAPPGLMVLAAIETHWPVASSNKVMDLMQTIGALRQLASDLPNDAMRPLGEQTADALAEIFSPDVLGREMNHLRDLKRGPIYFVNHSLKIFRGMTVDREALAASREQIEEAVDGLLNSIAKSDLSGASQSVLAAQLQLLKQTLERFESGKVGTFRATAYSIIGRVVVEIKNDKKIKTEDARSLIDDVLRVADIIDLGGRVLSLAAPIALLQLSGPPTDAPEAPGMNGFDAG